MENIVLNIKLTSANQLQIFLQFLKSLNFVEAFSVKETEKEEENEANFKPKPFKVIDTLSRVGAVTWTRDELNER